MGHDPLRAEVLRLLDGLDAHMPFEAAVDRFPDDAMNRRAPNVDDTPWQMLEHLRLTQADILDYVTNPDYVEREWPLAYRAAPAATVNRAAWDASVAAFLVDRAALRALIADDGRDLLAVLPGTPGHTLLREIRVIADHNAYHVGEFAILRQVMGTWPAGHDD
ncbi:MAG TPA: DinB family protein [Candidatus Deferrimicrobium sp.]|nr:DinB family protein [Candidatus Deferrimicrobium sp.]